MDSYGVLVANYEIVIMFRKISDYNGQVWLKTLRAVTIF